jgi:hypothetical protein
LYMIFFLINGYLIDPAKAAYATALSTTHFT